MTTIYALAARLCGMTALVCVTLAVMAYPGRARADDGDCYEHCIALHDFNTDYYGYMMCYSECSQSLQSGGCANSTCSNDCTTQTQGTCGQGKCDKDKDTTKCPTACKCSHRTRPDGKFLACECVIP